MIYTVLAVVGVGVAVVLDLAVTRTRLVTRAVFWTTYAIIVGFQLITNGLLTGIPVVRYRASAITGLRIAYAPVEDLLFGFALVLSTLSLWVWLGRARPTGNRSDRAGS